MTRQCILLSMLMLLSVGVGCVPSPKSGAGFTLPTGNSEKGKETFITLQCNACHRIQGIDQIVGEGEKPAISIALGGEVSRIQTYGELVTSIINPSHKLAHTDANTDVNSDGQSKMRNYNDIMTITQLTDLVTFLQSKYKLREIEPTSYPFY